MSLLKSRERAQVDSAVEIFSKVEGEIRDLVLREAAAPQLVSVCTELTGEKIGSLLQRVSADAVQQIDMSMTELVTLRQTLQNEATGVRREIIHFAALNQAARESVRTISESLTFWNKR
jgi:hypothetical protein